MRRHHAGCLQRLEISIGVFVLVVLFHLKGNVRIIGHIAADRHRGQNQLHPGSPAVNGYRVAQFKARVNIRTCQGIRDERYRLKLFERKHKIPPGDFAGFCAIGSGAYRTGKPGQRPANNFRSVQQTVTHTLCSVFAL